MSDLQRHDPHQSWEARYAAAGTVPDEPDEKTLAAVEVLRYLAAGGPVLELAVGHGRVAIPLAASGLEVDGIDYSQRAIDLIAAHPQGSRVNASVADMSDFTLGRRYSLVYLVFNTISNLTTQDGQVACFERAAAHLLPGGRFVIENGVPNLRSLPPGATTVPFTVRDGYVGLDEYTDLTHRQQFRSRHLHRRADGAFDETWLPFRFVWPAELDLMARIAGMTLEDRWSGWTRGPYVSESTSAVSVWRVPER